MPGSVLQSDFTAGELAPSLTARVDLAKYGKGCRTLRNFLVQPHGGAVKRPGFVLLDALPGEAVLVPFVFNAEQAYCLVFGEKWLRVATHNGLVRSGGGAYQVASPYTLEQARRMSFAQSADVLFIACHGVAPQKLMRHGHADWRFEGMDFSAPLAAPGWSTESGGSDANFELAFAAGEAYRLAGAGGTGQGFLFLPIEEDLYRQVTAGGMLGYEWAYGNGKPAYLPDGVDDEGLPKYARVYEELYRKSGQSQAGGGATFINGAKDSAGDASPAQLVTPYTYYVTALDEDGKESELSAGADITGPASNNWQAGDYVVLNWTTVPGAVEYRIYKAEFGGRPGYIASTGGTTFQDYNVTPSLSEGAPQYEDPFADGDYPGCVCLFEQRLVFASSPNRPQTIWMSKSGDYGNFAVYTPLTDDSPLELTLASSEVALARWMVALRSLILGTTGMEWEIASSQGAFTAKTAKATPQSYWGSSLSRAMVVGNIILHVNSAGCQVRNLQYDFAADSYGGADLSILAAHLLERHAIVNWTFQQNPDSIIWSVRSDGVLLGLTFQNEHQVAAWHRHDTEGAFKAVCSIPYRQEDSLFAVVERGGGFFLERMAERYLGGDATEAVFLDSALTYSGPPVSAVSGLGHLNGRTVGVFADGRALEPRAVSGGAISLGGSYSTVTAGLLYTADLETMPVEVAGQNGTSVSLKKYINTVNVLFRDSIKVKAGISLALGGFDTVRWQEFRWRPQETDEPFTGMRQVTLPNAAENIATVCVRSEQPTPATVLAVVSRLEVKG